MQRVEVVAQVKRMMGGGVVKLEMSDTEIDQLLTMATVKYLPSLTDVFLVTLPAASVIDMSRYGVHYVVRVHPGRRASIFSDFFEMPLLQEISCDWQGIQQYAQTTILRSEIEDLMSPGFKFVPPNLYLDNYSDFVTVEYLKSSKFDEIRSETAQSWILSYTLALVKESIGRIRSKFKPGNIPVDGDGDTLLSEAQNEKERLETMLSEGLGLFKILR